MTHRPTRCSSARSRASASPSISPRCAKAPVEIYPLDNLLALKIVLNAALQGGASRSLRMDSLGKSVAAQLLRMEIEAPA